MSSSDLKTLIYLSRTSVRGTPKDSPVVMKSSVGTAGHSCLPSPSAPNVWSTVALEEPETRSAKLREIWRLLVWQRHPCDSVVEIVLMSRKKTYGDFPKRPRFWSWSFIVFSVCSQPEKTRTIKNQTLIRLQDFLQELHWIGLGNDLKIQGVHFFVGLCLVNPAKKRPPHTNRGENTTSRNNNT